MTYFSKTFVQFFKDLSKNNSTAWFDENRKTYEKEVKKPFELFVAEMIKRIGKDDPEVKIAAKDAIFRINKDIRFSKDKTPYNTHMSANISAYGRKNKAYPGLYFMLSPEGISIFGGAYMLEKDQLEKMRGLIAKEGAKFEKAIGDKNFVKHFGKLQGETMKRIPEEWKAAHAKQPLIANKQFYFQAKLPASLITSDKLADEIMEYYKAAKPVNEFLKRAF